MGTIIYIILAAVVLLLWLYLLGFKQWLIYAVTEAETLLGGKTGQLKLKLAYDMAITTYPLLAKIMPFSVFKMFVNGALKAMRQMLAEDEAVANAVMGDGADD